MPHVDHWRCMSACHHVGMMIHAKITVLNVIPRFGFPSAGNRNIVSVVLFVAVALILAFEPVRWLVNTWREPAYDSKGFYVFAACMAVFFLSISSSRGRTVGSRRKTTALALLAFTMLVRLAGQVLAVNTIGALALVIDVWALGLLFDLKGRQRPVSPGWLAIAFAFSLPLERIAQRTIGYGLQMISSDGACFLLGGFFDDLKCYGVRLVLARRDVLVDLPCSGARSILLLLLSFALLAALVRPTTRQAAVGGLLALFSGLLANMLRISLLAAGIGRPELFFNLDVMASPVHDLIGLFTLAAGMFPLILWALKVEAVRPPESIDARCRHFIPSRIANEGWWLEEPSRNRSVSAFLSPVPAALALLVLALVIVNLPRRAVDVVRRAIALELPQHLAGFTARELALLPKEKAYFLKYGGAAKKAFYGPHQLLMVRTSAPLRHLHAPDDCLRGLGMKVSYLGRRFAPVPTARYRAISPDGQSYLVDVSFISDDGLVTSNVARAVWLWLQKPGRNWTAVQRITPEGVGKNATARFESAVIAALDLSPTGHFSGH